MLTVVQDHALATSQKGGPWDVGPGSKVDMSIHGHPQNLLVILGKTKTSGAGGSSSLCPKTFKKLYHGRTSEV